MSHLLHVLTVLVVLGVALLPVKVDADDSVVTVLVQDSSCPWMVGTGLWGLFCTHFIGARLPATPDPVTGNKWAWIWFVSGDWSNANYVLTSPTHLQSPPFFEDFKTNFRFSAAGTFWAYLSLDGTLDNFDYIQIRIVPHDFQGPITPLFQNPPMNWRYGWPQPGWIPAAPFTSGTDATGNDGAVATLSDPIMTFVPSTRATSTSISVWLAPLLVGIIMIAITVPIVIFAYKKGKQHAKNNQHKKVQQEEQIQPQQQQTDQTNRVFV